MGPTTLPEPGETGASRVTAEICLHGAEAAEAINWKEHLYGNLGELLVGGGRGVNNPQIHFDSPKTYRLVANW